MDYVDGFNYYYIVEEEYEQEFQCDYNGETCLIRDAMCVEQDMNANLWQRFLNTISKTRQNKLNELYEIQGMVGIEHCSFSCPLRVTREEFEEHEKLLKKRFGKQSCFRYGKRKKCISCKKRKNLFEMTEINDSKYQCDDCLAKEYDNSYQNQIELQNGESNDNNRNNRMF